MEFQLAAVHKEISKVLKDRFKAELAFIQLKPGNPGALTEAHKLLSKFQDKELKGAYLPLIEEELDKRNSQCKKTLSVFLQAAKDAGFGLREMAGGWRVGPLYLELDTTDAKVRFSYNRTPIGAVVQADSEAVVMDGFQAALTQLQQEALPEEQLGELFTKAYQMALAYTGKAPGERVYVRTVAKLFGFLAADLTHNVAKGKGFGEYPLWAFQYNLDTYRKIASSLPNHQRLGLLTGSQTETSKEGLTINGLDPNVDYNMICHVAAALAAN